MLGHQKGTKYQEMNNFMQFYLISWFLNVPGSHTPDHTAFSAAGACGTSGQAWQGM